MAKYLKTWYFRDIQNKLHNKKISHGRMLELIQDEVVKNYKKDNTSGKKLKRFFSDIWLGIKESTRINEKYGKL
jgi:hypothetical protein